MLYTLKVTVYNHRLAFLLGFKNDSKWSHGIGRMRRNLVK